jgi:hypothetical protein
MNRNLVVWEHEWYWVFHGLVRGTPASDEIAQDWEPIRPPKLSGITELNKERLAAWNAKSRTPEEWVPKHYGEQIKGQPAEPNDWNKILRARTPAQVRDAYRSMRPWVEDLEKHAAEFLTAKKYRYPGSRRPSTRTECNKLIVGYSFNLHDNNLISQYVDNLGKGKAHQFIAYRVRGGPPVTIKKPKAEKGFS